MEEEMEYPDREKMMEQEEEVDDEERQLRMVSN